MKPYYQDKWVTIYHGDCREILPHLDVKVDFVLTDPPYNTDDIGKRHFKYEGGQKKLNEADYSQFCKDWWTRVQRFDAPLIFTCGIAHLWEYPPARWVLCWYKPSSPSFSKLAGYNCWEPILVYGRPGKFVHDVITQVPLNFITDEWRKHPCPKPPALWDWLIMNASNAGTVILDPFLGSGTTCFCAKKLNRYSIGIEIEEKYCEIAARRCCQEVMELA